MLLAQAIGARRILEIGTLGGYSTIWLARGLRPRRAAHHARGRSATSPRSRAPISPAPGFADMVEVRVGRAHDTLPGLAAEAPFDLIFIDADKPGTPGYFQWAVKLSRRGSLIVVDNVVREGACSTPTATPTCRACAASSSSPPPTRG